MKPKIKQTRPLPKRIRVYTVLAVDLLLGVAVLGTLRAPGVYLRAFEACRDLICSVLHFYKLPVPLTVSTLPRGLTESFPKVLEDLKALFGQFFGKLADLQNLVSYAAFLTNFAFWSLFAFTCAVVFLGLPFGIVVWRDVRRRNTYHGERTKALERALRLRETCYLPLRRSVRGFFRFFREKKRFYRTFVVLVLFYLNVFTVAAEFLAFYFSFDFLGGIGIQLVKLFYDVITGVSFLPWWLWIPVAFWAIGRLRREIGFRRLEAHEETFRASLDKLAVAVLVTAPMREGKTSFLTAMAMSFDKIDRENAKNGMREIAMMFPDFPWIVLQKALEHAAERHEIYTLAGVREWISGICALHDRARGSPAIARGLRKALSAKYGVRFRTVLFGYDVSRFPTVYDRGLGKELLSDALADYAQLFFIYRERSLLVSNFGIRLDDDLETRGNDLRWTDDFFRKDPSRPARSRYSHVIHYDMFRPGKKVDPNDPYKNAFEFGVVAITEIAKERGNQYDREGKSAKDDHANILNDKFNIDLKIRGHSAEVHHKAYIHFLADEQRAGSLNADTTQNMDVIALMEKGRPKILMPFFAFEEALFLLSEKVFGKLSDDAFFNHGDVSLPLWILNSVIRKKIFDHYERVYNTFGGYSQKLTVQDGAQREAPRKERVFLSFRKIYSDRFYSAAWQAYYTAKAMRSKKGLADVPTFASTKNTMDENNQQGSYLFSELNKYYAEGEDDPPQDSE